MTADATWTILNSANSRKSLTEGRAHRINDKRGYNKRDKKKHKFLNGY